MASLHLPLQMLARDGYCLVKEAFDRCECDRFAHELHEVLAACSDDSISLRRANGVIYGARNLLAVYPAAMTLWRKPPLMELLTAVLGAEFGLVRGLFFDKPPQGNWSLPWHQDLTIAVADHSLTSKRFHNRTLKAGVPHVEAPDEILRQMLTLRFHLDDVTDENGPLQVLPGTHFGREIMPHACNPVTILAAAGDVLAMRPLLSHASASARVGTSLHRRVIHLEFAASRVLPDGYAWHQFIAGH